jgi:hypothetical protein
MTSVTTQFSKYIGTTTTTVRKSRNINRAKLVFNFLICGTNDIVEHYVKRIRILHGCPFEG